MNYTKVFILDMVNMVALSEPNNRHITIIFPTKDPKRSFVLAYDVQLKKVNSVIEQIGRRKRVSSVESLLNEVNPTI